jgi:MFS family permease
MSLLLLAVPVAAQSDDGWLLANENDDVLIGVGRDVVVGPTEEADGVVVVNGTAVIEGNVRWLAAVDADVTISGSTARVDDLFIITGTLTADDGATLGTVYYTGTELSIDESSVIVEDEVVNAQEELVGALAAFAALLMVLILFLLVGWVIASLAMTLLVIAFGSAQTRRAAATIGNDVLKVIVVGLLMTFVPAIVIGLLFVTIVGIPLALVLGALWGFVAFLGQVVVATWIGERILPRARMSARPYGAAFLGMVILILLLWTGIVPLIAGIFGLGAVTLAGWRVLRSGGVPPMPPGYGMSYGQPMPYAQPPYAPPPYAPPPPYQDQWPPQGGQPPGAWPGQ